MKGVYWLLIIIISLSIGKGGTKSSKPVQGASPLAEEATESKGTTLLQWSDFLLQKLNSYREALNLRGGMAPLPPIFATYVPP